MLKLIIIIFNIFLIIKCQEWYGEITLYDQDNEMGYAGDKKTNFTDFYLCSERFYRVHFFGENKDIWSEEFTACHPVGNCKQYIDGISISGGLKYRIRIRDDWKGEIKKYDINDPYGYAGILNRNINAISIEGNEIYRAGKYLAPCSNEKEVLINFINIIFGRNLTDFNYNNEEIIYNDTKNKTLISIKLLNSSDITLKGKIEFKIKEDNKIINSFFGELIGNNLRNHLKSINIDIDNIKLFMENIFLTSMPYGNVAINFYWNQRKIEIDIGIKIKPNHYSYRGGYKINIYLNDEDFELLTKTKSICEIFLKYSGKKSLKEIRELLNDCDSFEKLEKIMNELDVYSTVIEEIILYLILFPILKK